MAGAAALTGCVDVPTPGASRRPSRPSAPPSPPPAPPPYLPPAGEALPNFKQAAGRFAQALATFDAPGGTPTFLPPADFAGSVAELKSTSAPLRPGARWARAGIDVVQYGGLTPVSPRARSGVALVVVRQVLFAADGRTSVVRRTLDVRLVQHEGRWRVDALASAGGAARSEPDDLPEDVSALLRSGRVDLPDSARWDLYSGQVAPDLVRVLSLLSDVAPVGVTVLKTGHPQRVVDGRSAAPVSAHWLGRAVDVNAIAGVPVASVPVVDLRRMVEAAGALSQVAQVGAPRGLDLDGSGSRRFFTNLVHADHLHVAVKDAGGVSGAASGG